MSDIPSDFDPALLFSDYLPNSQSEYPSQSEFPPSQSEFPPSQSEFPEHSNTDDLEAIDLVVEETRERLNRKGVVIRHRQLNPKPAFRSSSLPPETPTRAASSRGAVWDLQTSSPCPGAAIPSSPTTPRANMTIDSSALSYPRSSPPLQVPAPAKRRGTADEDDGEGFSYPDSDEEAMATADWDNDDDSLPTSIVENVQKAPTALPRPVFNLPLSGGLFSKKFTPSSSRTSYLPKPSEGPSVLHTFRTSLTPPPRAPSPDQELLHPSIPPKTTPPPPTAPLSSYISTYLPVVLSSGETFQIRQKPPRVYSTRDTHYMSTTTTPTTTTYFGVPISSLLSDYNAQKRITLSQPSPTTTTTATTTPPHPHKQPKTHLWSEKYRAKRFTDLIGDERTHRQVLRWFKRWDPTVFPSTTSKPPKHDPTTTTPIDDDSTRDLRKILLIHGPPGLGKTTLAHVAAKQAGYEVIEVNASDERSAGVVKGRVKDILGNSGVKTVGMGTVALGRPVCLVVDEIDGVTGGGGAAAVGNEGGFVKALIEMVVLDQKVGGAAGVVTRRRRKGGEGFRLRRPIVAICNDLYAPALKALRPLAEIVNMRRPPAGLMVGRLKSVLSNEGFRVEDGAVRRLVELSCMGGEGAGRAGGDMRAAMVGCEWIACRLRAAAAEKRYLTRKIVEEEFGDGGLGEADGKGGGGGRGSVREAVERVFYAEVATTTTRGKKDTGRKKSSIEKLREVVEGLGEFDKILADCFGTYLTRPYHDDPFLTKPNAAGEWLWFSDLLSTRVWQEQDYELAGYLSSPILAFHQLFASATRQKPAGGKYSRGDDGEEEEAPQPFTGPQAEWEVRECTKENRALIQSVHTSMIGGIRLHQAFKSADTVAMELAPWVSRILAPSIKPIVVGGSGPEGGVASVRREGEKKLVARGVEVMATLGIEFEKVKVEGIGGGGNWGWVYRMEPPLDSLSVFRTFTPTEATAAPIRYAVRQVLDQALRKELLLQREAARQARMGTAIDAPQLKRNTGMTVDLGNALKRKKNEVKKDFFGRVVVVETRVEEEEGGKRKKVKGEKEKETVWLSFHEGFSNAVRKGVTLDEFMGGLM